IDVLSLDDAATADVADNIERAIRRARIGNENFVCDYSHRFNTSANVSSLVLTRNEHGQWCSHDDLSLPALRGFNRKRRVQAFRNEGNRTHCAIMKEYLAATS